MYSCLCANCVNKKKKKDFDFDLNRYPIDPDYLNGFYGNTTV